MKQRALIDINMLLDTRLAVLARLNTEATHTLSRSDWYQVRDKDRFEEITHGLIKDDEFKEMYERYEVETLVNSVFTNYLYVLRDEISEIFPKIPIMGLDDNIVYDINVYPYKLLDSEKEILRRAISHYLSTPAIVNVVDTAYHILKPRLLANNYDMLAIYNYEDWLRYHEVDLFNNPIQDFTIFYPRIAPSGVVPEPTQYYKDPFLLLPMTLTQHVQMSPLATPFVCWNPDIYLGQVNHSE